MNNNISPNYLSSLVPQSVETTTHYSLRDATNKYTTTSYEDTVVLQFVYTI